MLLAEPPRTQYDFHFDLLRFPVRVTPFFWIAALVLGWGFAVEWGQAPAAGNPGQGVFLVLWTAAMFISILIHELGHAVAMRYYGIPASIVLYQFGGLAIPDSYSSSFGRLPGTRRRENQLVISAAGPAAQLLLAAIVIGAVELAGYGLADRIWPLNYWIPDTGKPPVPSLVGHATLFFLAGPSTYWALLNLLPVYPLDGGQISRAIFVMSGRRDAVRDSLGLSLLCAGGCAFYAWTSGQIYLAILFLSLAVSSYQLLQAFRFGGGSW